MPKRSIPLVLAYLRVSTAEQVESGAGLAAQRMAIEGYSSIAGLVVDRWFIDEGVSGAVPPRERTALSDALARLATARSGALIVAKPDRLARRATDLLALRDAAEREGWALRAADGSLDMGTPHGRALATMMGAFAELERDLIRVRTREGLAAKKAQGVRLGRRSQIPVEIRTRIAAEREAGRTLAAIADRLTAEGVPTVGNGATRPDATNRVGARWYPSTVRAVLRTLELDEASARAARKSTTKPSAHQTH